MFTLLCRLKWAGLLPFARLVESTHEDLELHPRHEVIETERRMTLDRALLIGLVDRWRPETHTFHLRWGDNDIIPDSRGGYMAVLTTPPPDPTQQSQTGNQEVESTQYYRAAPNRYGWMTPPPRGP
jgi:hypothetical protein